MIKKYLISLLFLGILLASISAQTTSPIVINAPTKIVQGIGVWTQIIVIINNTNYFPSNNAGLLSVNASSNVLAIGNYDANPILPTSGSVNIIIPISASNITNDIQCGTISVTACNVPQFTYQTQTCNTGSQNICTIPQSISDSQSNYNGYIIPLVLIIIILTLVIIYFLSKKKY